MNRPSGSTRTRGKGTAINGRISTSRRTSSGPTRPRMRSSLSHPCSPISPRPAGTPPWTWSSPPDCRTPTPTRRSMPWRGTPLTPAVRRSGNVSSRENSPHPPHPLRTEETATSGSPVLLSGVTMISNTCIPSRGRMVSSGRPSRRRLQGGGLTSSFHHQ